jgi:NitT/TauT family transport system permease protein
MKNWKGSSETVRRVSLRIAGSAILLLIAEAVTRLELVPPIYFPYVSTVTVRILELLVNGPFLHHVGATLLAWACAMACSVAIGAAFGIAIGSSDLAFRVLSPVINLMRPIPSVCLLPLAILVLGSGYGMKIALATYAMTWPILYNTVYGIHAVDPVMIETARCFALKRLTILWRISVASALPFIFTGVRISAAIGLVVLVSAELLADSDSGIGTFIMRNSSAGGNIDRVFAAAAITGLLGILINAIFAAIDRRKLAWRFVGEKVR